MTTTLIAKRTRVGGRIDTHGDVVVEGRVEGTIVAGGTVTVGVTGVAVSDIHAGRAVVLGIVIGNVDASERIDVAGSARIVGDVRAPSISLASPATVEGRVEELPLSAPNLAPPDAITASGQVNAPGQALVPRPTLRIRGGALVRPAKPDSGQEPAVMGRAQTRPPAGPPPVSTSADTAEHPAPQKRRDPGPVPVVPRPPGRARMLPHGSGGGRNDA